MKIRIGIKEMFLVLTLVVLGNFAAKAGDTAALTGPVKGVYDHYFKIESELAKDSLKGVREQAEAMAKAVQGDEAKVLPVEMAKLAETLAQAKDLKEARTAFKPVSVGLIKYLVDHKVPKGVYHEVYCPMAKASWLQADTIVKNPYFGKEMETCGEIRN